MVCMLNCSISLIFIISMIYMMFSIDKKEIKTKMMSVLNEEEQQKYKNIINERRNIYLFGYVIGLILSLLMIYFKKSLKLKINKNTMICFILAVSFLTTYFFYILYPKSDYMINYLDNEEKREAWLYVYKQFNWNYHFGLVLGIIGVFFLGYAFC